MQFVTLALLAVVKDDISFYFYIHSWNVHALQRTFELSTEKTVLLSPSLSSLSSSSPHCHIISNASSSLPLSRVLGLTMGISLIKEQPTPHSCHIVSHNHHYNHQRWCFWWWWVQGTEKVGYDDDDELDMVVFWKLISLRLCSGGLSGWRSHI